VTEHETVAAGAADALARATGSERHDLALVLGSGWASAADSLGRTQAELPVADLPGFVAPSAIGHGGTVRSVEVDGKRALVFLGRVHLYEGLGVEPVVHPVRTAVAAGCRTVILTNACGAVSSGYEVGRPVLISDHISLTGVSPLRGASFVDLSDLYSARLRARAREADPALREGIYAHWPGPAFETPAEIRMIRTLGADLVGMSTVPEAIAAHALGAEVVALSLVTNLAAGLTDEKIDHREVLAEANAAAPRLGALLEALIRRV
jgi:purine-nucleoside phosphorylase